MIAFVQGKIDSYGTDWIIVENAGMGWRMFYPHPENISLGQSVKVYTYLHVREDDVCLYGFESAEEENLFLRLISVKGLGPKTAMSMLAKNKPENIIASIEQGNISFLKAIPGIGNKTASQILLDLKGKLVQTSKDEVFTSEVQDAADALKNLGYKQGEISAAAKVMSEQPGLNSEQYLKLGLQFLARKKIGG